jgi:hypothetical protein
MTAVGTERILGDFKFNSKAGKQINYIIYASPDLPESVLFFLMVIKNNDVIFLFASSGSSRCPKTLFLLST